MFRPAGPIMCRKPIAATIDGITKGIVRIDFTKDCNGHLCLPSCHAIGIPIISVNNVDNVACKNVNPITP